MKRITKNGLAWGLACATLLLVAQASASTSNSGWKTSPTGSHFFSHPVGILAELRVGWQNRSWVKSTQSSPSHRIGTHARCPGTAGMGVFTQWSGWKVVTGPNQWKTATCPSPRKISHGVGYIRN